MHYLSDHKHTLLLTISLLLNLALIVMLALSVSGLLDFKPAVALDSAENISQQSEQGLDEYAVSESDTSGLAIAPQLSETTATTSPVLTTAASTVSTKTTSAANRTTITTKKTSNTTKKTTTTTTADSNSSDNDAGWLDDWIVF